MFEEALATVFKKKPRLIYDIGGNTGKFSIACCKFNEDVNVHIFDLPGQLNKALENAKISNFEDRITGTGIDWLSDNPQIPAGADTIWMSQFLDCFSKNEILKILRIAVKAMNSDTELIIIETYTDRQEFSSSKLILEATSILQHLQMAIATEFESLVNEAGLTLLEDKKLGDYHTMFTCKKKPMSNLKIELKEKIIEQLNLEDIAIEEIADTDPLFGEGLGLDSIDALELIVMLDKDYGIKLADPKQGRTIFESIDSMAAYIEENRVAITGMGVISAIGNNASENYKSLISGAIGISKISHIDTVHADQILVGEIKTTNAEFEKQLDLEEDTYSRSPILAIIAAKEAIQQAGHWQHILGLHAGDCTQKIAEALGLEESFVTTISTACSSAANAIMLGARMIKSGRLDRVIVGGTDALSKFTINGFKTLMILSDTHNTPFDENRKGLNLGEAAAFLVLESDELVAKENKEVLAYVKGYGNSNDAFHQTASSENGDGAVLAMEEALRIAGLKPKDIDRMVLQPPNNDLSEGRAIIYSTGSSAKNGQVSTVSSQNALKEAGLTNVDAIIVGTGLGCISDSEKFVGDIIDNKEQFLTPTRFIQSSHNTVAGQIALNIGCKGYNFTYVHDAVSFESTLLDASMQLENDEAKNILVGGVDEISKHHVDSHTLIGHIKSEPVDSTKLLASNTKGSVMGEGSHFFVLSNQQQESSYAQLEK
ncbi:3-oxoacyl-[acyl-carrier-protein] synthase 2 [Nymphon striatum]|nr:3-oxoacyl-[acyl-carrier-protein] synthase 2 [Nymphon striatum]